MMLESIFVLLIIVSIYGIDLQNYGLKRRPAHPCYARPWSTRVMSNPRDHSEMDSNLDISI